MSPTLLKQPLRIIPAMPQRPPQVNIPQTLVEREQLRDVVQRFVGERRESLVPPLVLDELKNHADELMHARGIDPNYRDYVGILLNNEVWREQLATVPYESAIHPVTPSGRAQAPRKTRRYA